MLPTIIAGCVGGIAYAVLGLVREKTKPKPEDFDGKKFAKSAILGAIIGGLLGYQGSIVDATTIEAFMASSALYAPAVAIVDKIVGIVWNLFKKY